MIRECRKEYIVKPETSKYMDPHNNPDFTPLVEVIGANTLAIFFYLKDINVILTTVSLIVAISFTCYKFYNEWRNNKKG